MCGGRTEPPSTSSGLAEPINIGTNTTRKELVLVTGGTGYVASHCVEAALDKGYAVRTTVRNPSDQRKCAHLLGLVAQGKPLELCKADLLKDEGWAEAVKGCSYVIHVASPVVVVPPKDESVIIDPAVQGTMRLFKAAAAAGVKRVVLTSSLAAIIASREEAITATKVVVTDETYAKLPEGRGKPYYKAKILQERAAWDFVKRPEARGMELVVFCPAVVGGPVLNGNESESSMIISASFRKQMPFVPDAWVPFIDVRDLATAHVVGMTHPKAAGERFLMVHEVYTFPEYMQELAPVLRPLGYHITTRTMSYNVARLVSAIEPRLKFTLYFMGINKPLFDGSKARRVLGLPPYRKWRDHRLDAALSIIEQAHVPMTPQYKAAREMLKVFEALATPERSPYWADEQEGGISVEGDGRNAQ